jgi:hypothetical protein
MNERINRKNDENLYQPKIHSRRIRELYTLKEMTGIPMTVLLDLAIQELIEKSATDSGVIYEQNAGARTKEGNEPTEL